MKDMDIIVKKLADFVEKNYKVFFAIILGLAILLNTYKLGEVPSGINADEAGMSYDAYCIANYGVDRYCKKNPVYFINFGDGQNALYTYITAFLIKILNANNTFIIRLPALILSVIEVIVCYLLVKEFRNKKEALLFMLLVTISPWHIMKSRWGLESYLFSPMLLFSIYSLIKAVKTNKRKLFKFCISGLLFGITLYTYAMSYIIIPIFLLLTLIYLIKLKKIRKEDIIAFAIPLFILALPLVLMIMVQYGIIDEINSFITIPKLFDYRGHELSFSKIFENIASLRFALWNDSFSYNSLKEYGTLYYFGAIAMIIGVIITIIKVHKKKKQKENVQEQKNGWKIKKKTDIDLDMIMLIIFASNLVLSILTSLNTNKLNGILISATYFELITLKKLYQHIKIVFFILLVVYITAFLLFIKSYFIDYANVDKPIWDNGEVELMKYLTKFDNRQIHVDDGLFVFSLYANPIPPEEFNNSKNIVNGRVVGYKNYDGQTIDISNCNTNDVYVTKNFNKASAMIKQYKFEMEIFKNGFYILY